MFVNHLNPINTYLHILNLNTLMYLHAPGDFAKSNLDIFRQLYLSISQVIPTPIPFTNQVLSIVPGRPNANIISQANLVIHFPAFLSRMPLAVANLVIHLSVILSQMPLAEVNLINTLDFIYIEHGIYCNCIHQKNFKLHKYK